MNTVEDIFKRLTEVQIEMEHLLSETNALHESLNDLLENENLQEIKPKKDVLKKQINELGYEIVTSTKQHSRHWICKNHSKTINIMVKESKYFNEADYTSWYTVNEGVEEFIDYFFFLFIDLNGETHWIYINKSKVWSPKVK